MAFLRLVNLSGSDGQGDGLMDGQTDMLPNGLLRLLNLFRFKQKG
jgi:hypothetical protein